jgi:hypothetical protein
MKNFLVTIEAVYLQQSWAATEQGNSGNRFVSIRMHPVIQVFDRFLVLKNIKAFY